VADDQLTAPVEEVEQRGLTAGPGEGVRLDDLDHRQPAALGV